MAPPPAVVSILRTYRELVDAEGEWQELFAAADRPHGFLRHSWLCASWRALPPHFPNALRVALVRRDGRLSAACAFVFGYRRMRPIASLLGSAFPQLDEVLCRPSEFAAADIALMLRELGRASLLPRWFNLTSLREDSLLFAALGEAGMPRQVRKKYQSVFVPIHRHTSYEAYFETLSHNLRVDHRRRLRRLAELPGFAHVVETGETGRDTLDWLLAAKRRWAEEGQIRSAWLETGLLDRLLHHLAIGARDAPAIRVASLRVGDRIIAASLSLLDDYRVQYAVVSHDPEFGQHSPGRTLTLLEIAAAFARGVQEFDLGYGEVGWKLRLGNGIRNVTAERILLR
jgi:CelD/BcsL family acetyltransferase involved in cellulose biosynthesis